MTQVYILIGSLVETTEKFWSEQALPYLVGVLAARLLLVLLDPLHFLYTKANVFLMRRPHWTPKELPSYWVMRIILNPPTEDGCHWQEIEWLLDTLIDGLRSSGDMKIYHRSHAMDHVLTLAASPNLPTLCFDKIIDLLFRCTYVDGSTTLITGYGLLAWLEIHMLPPREDSQRSRMKLLGQRAYETSDQARIDDWSDGQIVAMLARLGV